MGRLSVLVVRRRSCAVSNDAAMMHPLILRDAAKAPLLRMRQSGT
jgi:hypothetical protein